MKRVGVCFWGGNRVPSDVEIQCIILNCSIFDEVYMITGLTASNIFNKVRNLILLDEYEFYQWIKDRFSVSKLPAYNYIADILTYNAADVLIEVYGINVMTVCKFDCDAVVYNSVLLDYALVNVADTVPTWDEAIRIYDANYNKYYRNCGIFFTKVYSKVRKFDCEEFKTTRDACNTYIEDFLKNPTDKYTQIGPHLANSKFIDKQLSERERIFVRDSLTNDTLFPGILGNGTATVYKERYNIGFHLTLSDCKKYGYEVRSIVDEGDRYKLETTRIHESE